MCSLLPLRRCLLPALYLCLYLRGKVTATSTTDPPSTLWVTYGVTENTIQPQLITTIPTATSSGTVTSDSVTVTVYEEATITEETFVTETTFENFTETATVAVEDDGRCPEPYRIVLDPGEVVNFTTPLYPERYVTDLECHWFISATQGGYIKLTPLDFEVELRYDYVTFGSGPNSTDDSVMLRTTGTETPEFFIGGALWIKLESDETVGRKGFLIQAEWTNDSRCFETDFTCLHDSNQSISCWHPGIECDSHHHCPDSEDEIACNYCGQQDFDVSNGEIMNITSPLYPSTFRSAITCEYRITANSGGRVILEIVKFALLGTDDVFVVGNGHDHKNDSSVLLSHKNNVAPPIVTSAAHHMWITFTTDGNVARNTWFFIHIRELNETVVCNRDEFACESGTECIRDTLICDGQPHCLDFSDEINCDVCADEEFLCQDDTCIDKITLCDGDKNCPGFTDELNCVPCGDAYIDLTDGLIHVFTSPLFPEQFPIHLACIWLVTAEENYRILLNVSHFEMHQDYVTIGEEHDPTNTSSVIMRRHGASLRPIVTSRGSRIWITFEAQPSRTVYTGFSMDMYQYIEIDGCDGTDYLCDYGLLCVSENQVCDGTIDCPDFSDESGCQCPNEDDFMCPDESCITQDQLCDGDAQCSDFIDERQCRDICGPTHINLTNSTEEFLLQSPRYPGSYFCNIACLWMVTGLPGYRLQIEIQRFILNPRGDTFTIGDEHDPSDATSVLATFTYKLSKGTTYLAGGNQMWLTLTTLCTPWYYGGVFQMTLRQRNASEGCGEGNIACTSGGICLKEAAICDGISDCPDYFDESDCEKQCGIQQIDLTPNNTAYNLSYPAPDSKNGKDCVWYVTSTASYRISIRFYLFVLYEAWQSYVSMGFGDKVDNTSTVMFTRVGGVTPNVVTSSGTRMWIIMQSNSIVNDDSFKLYLEQFQDIVCGTNTFFCPSGLMCVNDSAVCDGVPNCPEYGDEIGCGECADDELLCTSGECVQSQLICDGNADCASFTDERNCAPCGETRIALDQQDGSYTLASPGYPQAYPHLMTCVWFITAQPENRIFVTFVDFNTEDGYDFFSIGYGHDPENASNVWFDQLSGTKVPVSVASPANTIWLGLKSDPYYNERGFVLVMEERSPGSNVTCKIQEATCANVHGLICLHESMKCDGIRFCPNGGSDEDNCGQCGARNIFLYENMQHNLTSPGYPLKYGDDIDCEWRITALNAPTIMVSILDFDVERGYDFFSIGYSHDIANPDTLIASLTGLVKLRTLTSQGSEMWMRFTTDRSGRRQGFFLQLQELSDFNETEAGLCEPTDVDCGSGFCASADASCDGYNDCLNLADELGCVNITCPGSYLCDLDPSIGIQQCVPMDTVCDGRRDCPMGDDERQCDTKKCPSGCECYYQDERLFTKCNDGWDSTTIQTVARTTYSLELSGSNVSTLERGAFKGLSGLISLSLSRNNITRIEPRTFDGLYNLTWLDLSSTVISVLESQAIEELTMLQGFFLFEVPIDEIQKGAFDGLTLLKILVLVKGEQYPGAISVADGGFRDVSSEIETLYVDDHRLCCFFHALDECVTLEPQPPLFMCGSLMQNTFLRVSMWILGVSACFGNIFVIILRLSEKNKHSSKAVHSFLVFNLAISDFFMGCYMLILAAVDVYYGDRYFEHSDAWRASGLCRFAGFISLLSSEGSVFFITIITIDRFLCIIFPFSQFHLRYTSARVVVGLSWLVSLILSIIPTVYADPDSDVYDLSDVCIGLPLITRPTDFTTQKQDVGGPDSGGKSFDLPVATGTKPAWYFSIVIFLGVNVFCFTIIAVCYTIIFIKVKLSLKEVKRKLDMAEEIKMAMKMAVIVGTDFLCWMPIVIMGILSQTGLAVIPLQMYTWSVVFILPINSSLNPYLYTISSAYAERKREQTQSMRMLSMSNAAKATKFASDNTMHSVMDAPD